MQDIGYPVKPGTSDIAYTSSFPLFTDEAVRLLRTELLDSRVKDLNGPFVRLVPGLASFQVRGYGGHPGLGQFTKDIWTHSKTLEVLSQGANLLEMIYVLSCW